VPLGAKEAQWTATIMMFDGVLASCLSESLQKSDCWTKAYLETVMRGVEDMFLWWQEVARAGLAPRLHACAAVSGLLCYRPYRGRTIQDPRKLGHMRSPRAKDYKYNMLLVVYMRICQD
jgi:hypothetical protein